MVLLHLASLGPREVPGTEEGLDKYLLNSNKMRFFLRVIWRLSFLCYANYFKQIKKLFLFVL